MADRNANGPEENNIRDLVENCIHNDDITPLIRLVFEAQSIPSNPKDIQGNRQIHRQMYPLDTWNHDHQELMSCS
jgi:hypothetical protein